MRHPVTDVALLAYIAKKNVDVLSYTDATRACKSSSSASRALHQLIKEGLLDPQPKMLGLRYVTQYVVTEKGRQVAHLALQLTQLREVARAAKEGDQEESPEQKKEEELGEASAPVNNSQLPTAAATPSGARISKNSIALQTGSRSSENGPKLTPSLQKGRQGGKKSGKKKIENNARQASEPAVGKSNKSRRRKKKEGVNYNGE